MFKALLCGVDEVAVKVISATNASLQAGFQKEAKILAFCRDKRIVEFIGAVFAVRLPSLNQALRFRHVNCIGA